jgi:diaminopimelate epimerase
VTLLPFWKTVSVGNDFPVLHRNDVRDLAEARGVSEDFLLAELAVRLTDRHFGVGGDGLLVVDPQASPVTLRMFNPDGTEDFCGNGIRCAVHHLSVLGVPLGGRIVHGGRTIAVENLADGTIATEIGVASYDPESVPVRAVGEVFDANVWEGIDAGTPLSLFGSALTTGSTHVVIPTVALPDDETFRSVSAKIEVDPRYPERTSVIWCQTIEPKRLKIRIWERGVGETQGCGTGSSAAAADHLRRTSGSGEVVVENPGGTLRVRADRWDAPLTVIGTANQPYEGTLSPEVLE